MNKKGFAISVILYFSVFLVITIFYILLGIVKARYNVSSEFKNSVISKLNGIEYIYNQFGNDNGVNALVVNPNGGRVLFNGEIITQETSVVKYVGDTINLPNALRDDGETTVVRAYTVSFDVDGLNFKPNDQTANVLSVTKYNFQGWDGLADCGDIVDGVYTFPDSNWTTCTKTASWQVGFEFLTDPIILPTISSSSFLGWKAPGDNTVYSGGSSYTPTKDTEMVAQWNDVWADNVTYNDTYGIGCSDVQCALEKIYDLMN